MSPPKKKLPPNAESRAEAPAEDILPDAEAVAAMLVPVREFMQSEPHARVRGFLERLAASPPQVVLLEGGTADERLAAAHYWAVLLNCGLRGDPKEHPTAEVSLPGLAPPAQPELPMPQDAPCLECAECIRMVTHLHRDCFFLDGLSASIKIDEVRAVRAVLGEPPREARRRMVIFREAQALVEAAANALLKSFEEPRPGTSFVLLAPQRERLLPTLVSRSVCLTLPWPDAVHSSGQASRDASPVDENLVSWEAALCTFLQTGRGLFERTGTKGAVDIHTAHAVTGLVRRSLTGGIKARQGGSPAAEGLEKLLLRLPETRLRMLDEALAECQDSLMHSVNPTLVLEWLATRMYLLFPRA